MYRVHGRHEDDLFDRAVQSTKAVRQAASLYLAFIYDLQLGQLPLNLFFDRQAFINLYNISSPCQIQISPPMVIAIQMRPLSKN